MSLVQWEKGKTLTDNAGRYHARKIVKEVSCRRCGGPRHHVHHKDGNPNNNDPSNLEPLCARCHMTVDGRLDATRRRFLGVTGDNNPSTKVTSIVVAAIRARRADGLTHADLGREFGLAAKTIRRALGVPPTGKPPLKLTPQMAADIRARYTAGGVSLRQVGREFGVCHHTVKAALEKSL